MASVAHFCQTFAAIDRGLAEQSRRQQARIVFRSAESFLRHQGMRDGSRQNYDRSSSICLRLTQERAKRKSEEELLR